MGLKELLGRDDDSDLESERASLRRQRVEAAEELAVLKRALAERVAAVQQRERDLADATARVERLERKFEKRRGFRAKPAAPEPAETAKPAPANEEPKLDVLRAELSDREQAAAAREAELAAREETVAAREAELAAREEEGELDHAESVFELPPPPPEPEPESESEAIQALLAELHEAEQAFARTRAELAERSEELAEREAAVAARERTFTVQSAPGLEEVEALEARIRRLERDGGKRRKPETPNFSAGLRALEERGLRGDKRSA